MSLSLRKNLDIDLTQCTIVNQNCLEMWLEMTENTKKRKIAGVSIAIIIFVSWIFVDMLFFPLIGAATSYTFYEIVAYGSWIVVILVVFAFISWSGVIPTKEQKIY